MKNENEPTSLEAILGDKIQETCDTLGLAPTDQLRNSIFQGLATKVTPKLVVSTWKSVYNPPLPRGRRKTVKRDSTPPVKEK